MPSDDDDAFSLSFVRGDNGSEFLDDSWNYSTSVQTIPGAAGEASTNSAANDLKVIAKSVGAMGRTERRLLTAGKWLKVLKANGEDEPDQTKSGPDEPKSNWMCFRKAFGIIFPDKPMSHLVDNFLEMKQTSSLADWVPLYKLAGEDAGMPVVETSPGIHGKLQFIRATPTGFDKRIRRKHPTLPSMQEYLMDLHTDNEEDGAYTLHKLIKDGLAYEKKILMKVNKLNANLKKARQKEIKFYGSFEEHSEVAALQEVSFVQDQQIVTKDELVKLQADIRSEAQASQAEFRNETQATIQSAVAAVRNDIVGDVKTLFSSLEKKIDSQHQDRQQSTSSSRFDRRDEDRSQGGNRGGYRSNGRGRNESYGRSESFASRRAGGNREYPTGSGNRNCHICDKAGHPFMRCPEFHNPEFADKKEMAFKRIRRGVNHLELRRDSDYADDVRGVFDPRGQADDDEILCIACEELDHLEDEEEEARRAGRRGETAAASMVSLSSVRGVQQNELQCGATAHAEVPLFAAPGRDSKTATATVTDTATAANSTGGATEAAIAANSTGDAAEAHKQQQRREQVIDTDNSTSSDVANVSGSARGGEGADAARTTPESRALVHGLERLWRQFSTAALQLRRATKAGDEAHQQQLMCDATAVQEPLDIIISTWEELLTREPCDGSAPVIYLTPEQLEKCRAMREGDLQSVYQEAEALPARCKPHLGRCRVMSASQHEPASYEIESEDDEELIDPRRVEQSDKPVDLCREGTAPVLLNTLQSGSSDVCDLSHNRGHQEPRIQCSLNRQHAQPSPAVQGELVSVDAPVLPLVPDCRTSALTGGSWEQLMTGLSASNVKLAAAAPRPASGEPVVASSLRAGAFEGPRLATEEAVGRPQPADAAGDQVASDQGSAGDSDGFTDGADQSTDESSESESEDSDSEEGNESSEISGSSNRVVAGVVAGAIVMVAMLAHLLQGDGLGSMLGAMGLIIISAIGICCLMAPPKVSKQLTSKDATIKVAAKSKRQLARAKSKRRLKLGLARAQDKRIQAECRDEKEHKLTSAVGEEMLQNELSRAVWRPYAGRSIGWNRACTKFGGGCRRKLFRRQRMRKVQAAEAGPLVSAMMVLLTMVQAGDSWYETLAAVVALMTVTFSATSLAVSTTSALMNCDPHGFKMKRIRKWSMSARSMIHLIPSTAMCWWEGAAAALPAAVPVPALVAGVAASAACYVLIATIGSSATATAVSASAASAGEAWSSHWHGVYQCSRIRARYTAAFMNIDTETPEGFIRSKYLVDLGAAASVIPLGAFTKVCLNLKLAPSEASLRGASGHGLSVAGQGQLAVRMPGTNETFNHTMQVTNDGAMPAKLQILGIDFWHQLNSNIDMASQTVTGTTPNGEHFRAKFHVEKESCSVNTITAEQVQQQQSAEAGKHDITLAETVQVHPGQVVELKFVLPDEMVKAISSSWKHSWLMKAVPECWKSFNNEVLWEPTKYSIVTSDQADWTRADGGATDILPTGASILSPSWSDDDMTVSQFIYVSEEVEEAVLFPAGTTIGTVSLVSLATMNDPAIIAVLEAAEGEARLVLAAAADMRQRMEAARADVYSIMSEEGSNAQALRQTTVRHKPETALPDHDIRGKKSGKELIQIWEQTIKNNRSTRDQFHTWIKSGPGSLMQFGQKLQEHELRELQVLCFAFKDLFDANPKAPPEIKGIEHALYFKSNNPKPHRRPIPRLSRQELDHMNKELTSMLANHIIQHSDSEWATLPVFAKKKDGTLRTAIDYRGVNAQILGDNQAIPNIGEVLDSLASAKRFSCYDCSSGFWGLRLRDQDRHYTAFHGYHNGAWNLFEWLRMPFGLKSATATYQRMQQRILGPINLPHECNCRSKCSHQKIGEDCSKCKRGCDLCVGLLDRIVKVFVDDGCVYSAEEGNHVDDLARVFCRLAANHVSLKPVKCIFGADQILLLGHQVTAKLGIRPDPQKCAAILDMEVPQTVDALHNFIGAVGWVSKFIPEFAELAKPLRDIIHSYDKKSKANIKHEWEKPEKGPAALRAFEALRLSLASRPCLAFPDYTKPFIIITDASKVAIAAVICQLSDEGELRPIAYASTPLKTGANGKGGDLSLGISAKEGLALCFAVNRWRHLIYGTTCICLTDHSALQSLTNPTKEFDTERMARMAMTLSEHDLVIAHRPGTSKELIIADMLSRCKSANDPAKLESLMEQAWGCVGTLCRETEIHLSQQVMSEKSQHRRLQHMVDGSTIREMVKGKEVTSVQDMVRAIQAGDRELITKSADTGDTLPNRFDEMYAMITALELDATSSSGTITDDDVLAAQALDPYCRQMKLVLQGKETRTSKETLYQACKWQAPYHTVTPDGVLRRVLWKKGSKADRQVQEGRAPAVVPEAAKVMQQKLCSQIHEEVGHASYLKVHAELSDRYIWAGMSAELTSTLLTCNQCDYFGDKCAKAPITGHVTASEPASRIMMDVIHLKEAEGFKYILTLVDVFSRWGMAIPLVNIKAKSVTTALRRHAIPAGMGRPKEFLVDGGSEFKSHLQEACVSWGSAWRPHTPYHSESAGAVERFNKTLELRIAHFAKQCECNWVDALPLALEGYNGAVHAGLSKKGIAFSPAELWLGRKIRFNSDVRQTMHNRPTEVQEYGEWLRKHTQAVKDWIKQADDDYRQSMEAASSSAVKLRTLKVGDRVVLRVQDLDRKEKNAGAERWEGPYEVVGLGEMPTDYTIQREGSRQQPKAAHIDNLKQQFTSGKQAEAMEELAEGAGMLPAKDSATSYEVEAIVGEKGKSRASKHYLVKYKGFDDAWWQPAKNLYCPGAVQQWDSMPTKDRAAVTAAATVANPDDVMLVMDLRTSQQARVGELIKSICSKLDICRSRIRGITASPMCNSFTKLDHVNRERGNHFREPYAPYAPRKVDGSLKTAVKRKVAQEHDSMVENLLASVMQDAAEGFDYSFCIENPRGLLRHRPYMNADSWLQHSDRATTDYCVHDHDYQKPTDLWHSFGADWQPKGITGDGKCHQKCGKGKYKANGKFSHHRRHAGPAGSGVTGTDQMLQKWEIPHNLCAEVIAQMCSTDHKGDVILDLFSGGESYRKAVEAAGCIYVPIDLKTLERSEEQILQDANQLLTGA